MSVIQIKGAKYDLREKDSGKGYSIELSYFDMPQEVEGIYEKEKGIFHINFHYPDKEEAVVKTIGNDLRMKVGKNSGKVLGFEVEVKNSQIREISLRAPSLVKTALEKEAPKLTKVNQQKNYSVIGKVLDEYKDDLYKELVPA